MTEGLWIEWREQRRASKKRRGGACRATSRRIRFPSRTQKKTLPWGVAGLRVRLCMLALRPGSGAPLRAYPEDSHTRAPRRLGAIWRLLVAECCVDDAASRQQPRVHMCDTRIQKQGKQARLLVVHGHPSSGRVFNGRASRRS